MSISSDEKEHCISEEPNSQEGLSFLAIESLRPIAQRQMNSLLHRLAITHNTELYLPEIYKLIQHEKEECSNDV